MTTKLGHLGVRIVVAALVGFIVFLLATFVAWRNGGPALLNNSLLRLMTRMDIQTLNEAVTNHLARTGSLPGSLGDLNLRAHRFRATRQYGGLVRRGGVFVDGWGRPYVYTGEGTNFTIVSYARDGQPGGTGFHDPDISNRDLSPYPNFSGTDPNRMPGLRQFLLELPSTGMILACLVCGVLAFTLCMTTIRADDLDWHKPARAMARIIGIVAVTVFVSLFLIVGHIPSGH